MLPGAALSAQAFSKDRDTKSAFSGESVTRSQTFGLCAHWAPAPIAPRRPRGTGLEVQPATLFSAVTVGFGRSVPNLAIDHMEVQTPGGGRPVAPVDKDQPAQRVRIVLHHDADDLVGVVHVVLHSCLTRSCEHVVQYGLV